MPTITHNEISIDVPEAIHEEFVKLPAESLATITEHLKQHFLEVTVCELYRRADIYLTDASVALGHYPNVEKTMKWLGERSVPIGGFIEGDDYYNMLKDVLAGRIVLQAPLISDKNPTSS